MARNLRPWAVHDSSPNATYVLNDLFNWIAMIGVLLLPKTLILLLDAFERLAFVVVNDILRSRLFCIEIGYDSLSNQFP